MAEAEAVSLAPKIRPIRESLFLEAGADGRPKLLASRCRETGQVFWPRELLNPVTHRRGTLEDVEISGDARLVSYTVVRRGLEGFASPYALAAIELAAGPTLIAQLDDWQGKALRLGQELVLVIGTIRTDKDGTAVVGPKFRPVGT
jgi:uncharacterized protein